MSKCCFEMDLRHWLSVADVKKLEVCRKEVDPSKHRHRPREAMAARSVASAVCRMLSASIQILIDPLTGLPHGIPPSPQPSSFVTICYSADTLPVARDQTSHRQGCRVRSRCSVHEGHPRNAPVRFLKSKYSDPRSPGCQPGQVHCLQRS